MSIASGFQLAGLEVLSVSARQAGAQTPHIDWFVDYAPEVEAEVLGRVVFATLHAFNGKGGGEATVACIVLSPSAGDIATEDFRDALENSDALEALYDYARTVLRGVLGTVDVKLKLPKSSPDPVMSELVRPSKPDEAIESD